MKNRSRLGTSLMLLFALACTIPAYAEEKPFLIRPFIKAGWFGAELTADEEDIEFVPNPMMNQGVKFGYRKLTASVAFGLTRLEDEDDYGKSTDLNAEISYPFRVFRRELLATAFVYAHENLSTPASGDERYLIDGMDALDLGLEGVLFLNRNFSLERVMDELEPRSGSSGSWLVRSSVGVMHLGFLDEASDRIFIPTELADSVGDLADLHLLRDVYASIAGGYVFDWNIRRSLFFTTLVSLGMTVSRLDLTYADGGSDNNWTVGPSVSVLLGLTYAGRTFHAGLSSRVSEESAQAGEVLITGLRTSVMLFAGMRF